MRKFLVYGPIIATLILAVLGLIKIFDPFQYRFEKIGLDGYVEYNKVKGPVLLYVYDSREGTKEYENVIKTALKDKETKTYALDYEKAKSNKETFKKANILTFNLTDEVLENSIPMLILIEEGQVKASINGIYGQKEVNKFVKDNQIK